MKLSFFSPKTQFENVGDALINREMIKLASLHSDVLLDLSRCPEDFNETLGLSDDKNIKMVSGGFASLLLSIIFNRLQFNTCFYFLSPGGYFGEVTGGDFLKRIINTFVLFILYLIGVKICHVGVSYERLGVNFLKLIKLRSLFLHAHIVRDHMSFEYAKSVGIKVNKVSPDLAFNIFDNETIKTQDNTICFSFRVDQDKEQKTLVKKLVEEAHLNCSKDIKFVFYSQVSRDSLFMKTLSDEYSSNTERSIDFIEIIGDIDQSLEFFQSVEFVVSNRLHVLLMSGCENCNLLACTYKNYNSKVQGIMASLSDSENAVLNMESIDKKSLTELFKRRVNIMVLGLEQRRQLKGDFGVLFGSKELC